MKFGATPVADAEGAVLAHRTRAGGRTLLWAPAEGRWERAARLLLVALVILVAVAGPLGARLP